VLTPFRKAQEKAVAELIDLGAQAVEVILKDGSGGGDEPIQSQERSG